MAGKGAENKRESLALRIAAGDSPHRAAKNAGVPYTTARRWLCEQEFKQRVHAIFEATSSRPMYIYGRLAITAARAAGKLLKSPDPEIQLKAIREINTALEAFSTRAALFREAAELGEVPDEPV
jgi:hypothetical protein